MEEKNLATSTQGIDWSIQNPWKRSVFSHLLDFEICSEARIVSIFRQYD